MSPIDAPERAQRQSQVEWERTFDAVPDLIAVLSPQHRIIRVNKALADRLGLTPEQCVGRPCHEAVHGLGQPLAGCPHSRTCADGRPHTAEVHEERLGGDFLVSTTPIFDQDGKLTASVHVARDITERKRAEQALREAAQMKSDLMSLVHHEYANALTNMKLAVLLLKSSEKGQPEEERSHSYAVLDRAIEKLRLYTENFLDLRRLESGRLDLNFKPIAVRSVVLDTLLTLGPMAEAQKLRLCVETDFPENLPVAVRADRDCLGVIVTNLISNAIKYTPEGGAIKVRVALAERRASVSVEDTGIGMSAEDLERIKTVFYRTPEGRQQAKGFGVGLSVVRDLLEKHGSRLEVESSPGQGSRFSFVLPLWDEAQAPSSAQRSPEVR